jgi:CrcB protein
MTEPPDAGHHHAGPIDPDIDLHVPGGARELAQHRLTLPAIAAGGAAGAAARYGLEQAWPTAAGSFPWATLVTNAAGCLLIGLLMVRVVEAGTAHPLVRPFLGVGVLGGFTTFSTYAVQTRGLWAGGHEASSLVYAAATPLLALVMVTLGVFTARGLLGRRTGAAG